MKRKTSRLNPDSLLTRPLQQFQSTRLLTRIMMREWYCAQMTRTLFVLLAFCLLLNHAQGQHCSDIRHFDFKNATIHVGLTDDNELQTVYNSSRAEAHTFRLRDGVA
jgi:hypothetical protein